jgi:bleomycin hydrolase
MTGTCWCFATTSLVESEEIRKENKEIDLSEMFTVRNMYIEKAKNYILRNGRAQFGEGGLGHDEIRAVASYGAVPLNVYTGLLNGATNYDHQILFSTLQKYLDSVLRRNRSLITGLKDTQKFLMKILERLQKNFLTMAKLIRPFLLQKKY